MKKRTKNIRTCSRKKKYTWLDANIKCKRLNQEGHYLNVYQCPNCGWYHLGHPFKPRRVRMAFERAGLQ